MKASLSIIILVMSYLNGIGQSEIHKKVFLNGDISLNVPDILAPITDEIRDLKYPQLKNKPVTILSTADGEVNLLMQKIGQPITDAGMEELKDLHMGNIYNSRPDAEWVDQGMKTINGQKVGFIKFKIKATDQKVFNYYVFVNVHGEAVLISFNCTEKKLPAWNKKANEILASLEVKK